MRTWGLQRFIQENENLENIFGTFVSYHFTLILHSRQGHPWKPKGSVIWWGGGVCKKAILIIIRSPNVVKMFKFLVYQSVCLLFIWYLSRILDTFLVIYLHTFPHCLYSRQWLHSLTAQGLSFDEEVGIAEIQFWWIAQSTKWDFITKVVINHTLKYLG